MNEVTEPAPTPGDTAWFTHDRFGLFIHWGLYSLAARHEWVQSREQLSASAYRKYFDRFDPDLYDPCTWAKAAAGAGMKYFIVTAKHHEGFCLWDTRYTDYKAPNTPAGRDLIRPMVEAFRAEGLRAGLYYSLLDWHHPDYTVDMHHPMRNSREYTSRNSQRDMSKYAEYMRNQVSELLTEYGEIDALWFDFSFEQDNRFPGKGNDVWESEKMIALARSLRPRIILNDRLEIDQDIKTPEQWQPRSWLTVNGEPVVWEACQTFSGSWGYHRDESTWKSVDMLIRLLIDTVSKGGNLLLNVGPTGRGEFDWRAFDRLQGIGAWMKRNSRSIYGCTQAPAAFIAPPDCRFTFNPEHKRLYLHIFSWPFKHIHLEHMAGRVAYAQFLHDASEVTMSSSIPEASWGSLTESREKSLLTLEIPIVKPDVAVPVIELFLK